MRRARLIDVDYASHGPHVDADRRRTRRAAGRDQAGALRRGVLLDGHRWPAGHRRAGHRVLGDATCASRCASPTPYGPCWTTATAYSSRPAPHPVLTVGMQETFEEAGIGAVRCPLCAATRAGSAQLARSVAQAFTAGIEVDWSRWFPTDPAPGVIDLPTYAFQRERYWIDGESGPGGDPAGLGLVSAGHPLLGAAVAVADGTTRLLTGRLSARTHPWLGRACGGGRGAGAGCGAGGVGAAGGRRGGLRRCGGTGAAAAAGAARVRRVAGAGGGGCRRGGRAA